MRRRDFIGFIGGAAAWPLTARAQQSEMPVVGFLSEASGDAEGWGKGWAVIRRGMAELGYVEGKNFASENRFKPESLHQAAADLVRRNVKVIFASGPEALSAISKATTSIPVIALDLESDPVAKGYVQSIARPGGNITGIFLDIPELSGKQLDLLMEIVPRLSRIAVFGIPGVNAPQFAATETAARAAGVEVEVLEVRVVDDLPGAMEASRVRHIEAGWHLVVIPSRGRIFEANRGPCARQKTSAHFHVRPISKKGRPHGLWTEPRHASKMRGICRQGPAR